MRARLRGIVLFEDSRAPGATPYAPHELVIACVADRVGKVIWDLKGLFRPIPRKGNANVVKWLRDANDTGGARVLAVFDRDQISALYSSPTACISSIREAILADAAAAIADRLTPVLLDPNVESVVDACCDATSRPRPVRKPKPAERDKILASVAYADSPTAREAVLASVPSLDYLVGKLSALL